MKTKYDGLEVAVIGMSGKFPGSSDHRSYWNNLRDGRELIRHFTDEELKNWGVPESHLRNEFYVKSFGMMDDKDCFDHNFFGYSPDEAAFMDPQTRMLHEHCWSALEDAGYTSVIEKQKISLFAGAARNDNWKVYTFNRADEAALDPFYKDMITSHTFISTLVAYKLNLRGSSFFVDTACSTSLSAVHLACRSLLFGDARIALAGAVTAFSHKPKGYFYQEGMIYSADGHCRAFDKDAGGTVGSEGVGVVVLKKLSEAIKDRDNIYCIIRGTAANNDGNQKVGYTAPSVKGQSDCIKMAHKVAGVDPRSISYIEAHGTATSLGDPVELRALNEAFAISGRENTCAIGAVKSNIGHPDTAAGVAGLMKVALSLQHRQLPPSLHFETANPEIDFAGGPFYVNTTLKEWEGPGDFPLRAGVSSFGIGGTNVHAVLEEAPIAEPGDKGRHYKILTLSARTANAAAGYIARLKHFLETEDNVDLADMAYTLQAGRRHFEYRKSLVYRDKDELVNMLNGDGLLNQLIRSGERQQQVVFMFSGAGSQYVNMGKGLYESVPLFREEMDKGFALLEKMTGVNYRSIIYPSSPEDTSINVMLHTQPVIFLFGHTLARLLMSWGITPQFMIGHSIGEYIAACLSGVFSYEDAMKLVVARGQLMNDMPRGSMLSVYMNEADAQHYVNDSITIAAVNGPEQVVFSGGVAAIDELVRELEGQDISSTRLYASHAGHSYMIDGIVPAYMKVLETVQRNAPAIPFVSNLTGNMISTGEATSVAYWLQHMRQTVRFSEGISSLLAYKKELVFIEIGGGHSLTTLVRQHQSEKVKALAFNLIRHPKDAVDDEKYMAENIGKLWEQGISINWNLYYGQEKRRRISLPTYAFEPYRHPAMVDPLEKGLPQAFQAVAGANGGSLNAWLYYPVWKTAVPQGIAHKGHERTYLFFSQCDELDRYIHSFLEEDCKVIEVGVGSAYEKQADDRYVIDPAIQDHYDRLFEEIGREAMAGADIIYAWGRGAAPQPPDLTAGSPVMDRLYFGLVKIIKMLLRQDAIRDKRITVLTSALHKVIGNERICYSQSLLLGLVNTLPQEHPVLCGNIDLDAEEAPRAAAFQAAHEIRHFSGEDRIVALRYGQRWIQDYQRNTRPLPAESSVIRKGGTYVVTGGLGNVGYILAEYLLKTYDVKLAITGRTKISGATGHRGPAAGKAYERWQRLKGISENVMYLSADVSDAAAFRQAVAEVQQKFGPVNGVVHAAGNVDIDHFELIEDITPRHTMDMLAPKVQGIWNIYDTFQDAGPDFVWITSSLATVLAGLSYSAYASANLFMDHFVAAISRRLPGWKCVGLAEMIFDENYAENPVKPRNALLPEEITALFEWSLLQRDCPLILETVEDLTLRIKRTYDVKRHALPDGNIVANTGRKAERPNISTAYVAPATPTEKKLSEMVEIFFGVSGIGMEDNFFELGGDSLKAMVLLKRIKKEFDTSIPIKDFFNSQHLRQIATEIDNRLWINKPSEKKHVSII
jgi:acyl transferase domain-containing protein/NAD(P)-dependent dehydrogenase (short-subunit alcohol dehydrogenase family)/acyl carrier protein